MTKSASINVRLYPDLKKEAEGVFDYFGLSLQDAITVFLKQSCNVGGFPFEMKKEPNEGRWNDPVSLAALEESNRIVANPSAYKWHDNVDALFSDLDAEDDDE
ncbi:MAG: type II toxin-antitoxin system RelB/DinJ family antitoxin [Defluviitaleaceae bacterium]|nr:type II toxin-antitoxin system RelB/DinJ family antitoxin [Defluviitaleaceae bacterium]MCL2240379.1 type II toxin-antitoxin system RelB/DinJ family antitoxin [Defluviitaleaceae bacterium]